MKTSYQVKHPSDFVDIINDIFSLYEQAELPNLIITLAGDLGAGKTTFTQTLAAELQVKEVVTSPTFTIMKQYPLEHKDFNQLVHIDAYRIEDQSEAKPLGCAELFAQQGVLVCIEWPEKISSLIPEHAINLSINIQSENERLVVVTHNH